MTGIRRVLTERSPHLPDLTGTLTTEGKLICSRSKTACPHAAISNLGGPMPSPNGQFQEVAAVQDGTVVCRTCPTPSA